MDIADCIDLELSVILSIKTTPDEGSGSLSQIYQLLTHGHYEELLKHPVCRDILRVDREKIDSYDDVIQKNVSAYCTATNNDNFKQLVVLAVGVACLQMFVQNNWSGPPTECHPIQYLCPDLEDKGKIRSLEEAVHADLSLDGMTSYTLARHILFLNIARVILLNCRTHFTQCQTADWWLLRCINIHQELLENRSPTLNSTALELIAEVRKKEPLMTSDKYREAAIQFHLEACNISHFYYDYSAATEHLNSAKKISSLDVQLTGAMGKKTQFQQAAIAQMMLTVERQGEHANHSTECNIDKENLPKDLQLNDDTLLDQIKVTGEAPHVAKMSATEQALVLSLCADHKRSHEGQGDLIKEEAMAFINAVLLDPQSWAIQTVALLQRCQWESESIRKMERSMMQLETLVNQFDLSSPGPEDRLHLLYCIKWPPRWVIQKNYAEFLEKIGIFGQALEIYERIQMWENVIACYRYMGKTQQAEAVIRSQLAIQETPTLLCFLAEVTDSVEYFMKAWELSNCRHARSMKSLGYHYLGKREYEQAMNCFEKALDLNGLQIGIWFSYGCAALALGKYDISAMAFHRCVSLDYDNFEAWNNLAASYIKSNQKKRAFSTLQNAIKCAYDNWRVWENFLMVAVDIGEFAEVIRAYHRLMDIKEKHTDVEVLSILVRAVNENMGDAHGEPAGRLRKKTQELFGRITSMVTGNAELWRLYAQLLSGSESPTDEDKTRVVQYLQKSHRCVTQTPNWHKSPEDCEKIAKQSVHLAKAYMECSESASSTRQAIQTLSSGKLALKGVATKIKQTHTDAVTGQLIPSLAAVQSDLEDILNQIITRIEQLNASSQ